MFGLRRRSYIFEQLPLFGVFGRIAGRETNEWSERFDFEDLLVCEGLEVAAEVGVGRGRIELDRLHEERAGVEVGDPAFAMRQAELRWSGVVLPHGNEFATPVITRVAH